MDAPAQMDLATAFEIGRSFYNAAHATTAELLAAESVLVAELESNKSAVDALDPYHQITNELDNRFQGARGGVRAAERNVAKARKELEAAQEKLARAESKLTEARLHLEDEGKRAPRLRRRVFFPPGGGRLEI